MSVTQKDIKGVELIDEIYNCDCIEGMRELPANSVDAIVTDPPYGLSFMGKDWDHGVPGEQFWVEALRVAKPGAYLLAFGGTRTYHRLACAIEDAGWEVRDCLGWLYGSGFPKSMDVSKAIDKSIGYKGKVIGEITVDVGMQGGNMHSGREYRFETRDVRETSELAKQWQGWGTCLKPAWEPIIMARKPIKGTVAACALEYGTGAINIDACRVGTETIITQGGDKFPGVYGKHKTCEVSQHEGRFPANIIHDGSDEVLAVFPQSKGQQGDVKGTEPSRTGGDGTNCYGEYKRVASEKRGDSGSAARFFYCAKASKKDRGEGNTHPTVKPQSLMQYLIKLVTPEGAVVLDPFLGSGSTAVAAVSMGRHYIGYELSPEYFDIACARLDEAESEASLKLFSLF